MCTTSGPADSSVRLDNGVLPTEETNRSSVPSKQMGCPVISSKQWSRGQKEDRLDNGVLPTEETSPLSHLNRWVAVLSFRQNTRLWTSSPV